MNSLLFNAATLDHIKATRRAEVYTPLWADDLRGFMSMRAKYLIYR